MIALARLSLRRPVAALLAWCALAGALGLVGFGISDRLSPSILVVPGTESARAQHLADATFGPSQLTPILLAGPARRPRPPGPRAGARAARTPRHPRALRVGHRHRVRRAAPVARRAR